MAATIAGSGREHAGLPFFQLPELLIDSITDRAYLLSGAALSPLYGKLSDLMGMHVHFKQNLSKQIDSSPGRKLILYTSIFIFLVSYINHHRW